MSHKFNKLQGYRKQAEFLNPDEIQKLELPLQENKITQAIKDFKPGKSPGPNGLTS